jgi:hypothetical protein
MAKKVRKRVEVKSDLPPKWDPKAGDTLEGLYLGPKQISPNGSTFLIHIIQDEDTGEVQSLAGVQIDRMLARIDREKTPNPYVWITYEGKKPLPKNPSRSMHNYKLEVEEGVEIADEEPWNAEEVEHEDDPSYLSGDTMTEAERAAALANATARN